MLQAGGEYVEKWQYMWHNMLIFFIAKLQNFLIARRTNGSVHTESRRNELNWTELQKSTNTTVQPFS